MPLPIKIELPEGFLDVETRCGYEISGKLKRIWAVELDLLSELKRVCQKHGLRFHVAYGTMIGAVRHKGFIPWDDDMDVWLPREDYDKLARIAPSEFKHPYFLQTALSDSRHFTIFNRLRNSMTTAVVTDMDYPDYNNGIYIDVFPLDCAPKSHFRDAIQMRLEHLAICGARLTRGDNVGSTRMMKKMASLLRPLARMVPYRWWVKFFDWTLRLHEGDSDYLTAVFSSSQTDKSIQVRMKDFDETVEVPYEFMFAPIPRNYDQMLRAQYGEYMQFPPVEKRGMWHDGVIIYDPDTPYAEWYKKNRGSKRG